LLEHNTITDTFNSIIVLLSNKKVFEANSRIRQHFFGMGCEKNLYENDRLMVYSNLYGENFFFNGDELRLKSIGNVEVHKVTIKLSNYERQQYAKNPFDFKNKLFSSIIINDDEAAVNLSLQKVTIVDLDGNESEVLISADYLYSELTDAHPIYRRAMYVKAMMDYKLYSETCEKNNESPILKSDFLRASKFCNVLYVKFGYAVTCHKAQGGEWDKVYTTSTYIPKEAGSESHYRWVYTAFTRAAKSLCVGVPYVR
jgi:hypothetical protein